MKNGFPRSEEIASGEKNLVSNLGAKFIFALPTVSIFDSAGRRAVTVVGRSFSIFKKKKSRI